MITTRLVAAFILSLLATLILFPAFIKKMQTLQYGQQIREDGPSRHLAKKGTPTMGGVIIILAAAIVSLILAGFSITLIAAVAVFAGCGSIGFMDDYLKVVKNRSLGLRARSKLAGEVIVALILIILVFAAGVYNPELTIPFTGATIKLGMLYPLFILVIVFSATNAVNLTDGIDGLAGGLSVIAFTAFSYIAYRYGSIELALFCATLAGSCLGFLFYNHHPARIFMGDAGSLALGGAFAAVAVLTKTELLLILIGGVFVLETLSVILQVISFRLTGKRILLMAPLHHHFELKGWSEQKVVRVFWSAGIAFAFAGVIASNRIL